MRFEQGLILRFMESRQQRKRGKSDRSKGKRIKVAYEKTDCDIDAVGVSASSWAPKNWREQYDNIKKMREKFDAPVDSVGASKLADISALPEVCFSLIPIGEIISAPLERI